MGRVKRWVAGAAGLGAMGLAGAAMAASDQPTYGPPPAWVKDVPIPLDAKPTGAAVDLLLLNNQQRLSPGDDEEFSEVVARVNASEGLAGLGNLIEAWDPSTQTLAIHRARILRGGRVIDLLAGGKKFAVIRRETGLEAATLDGRLTATLQPEDIRVGDVLDLAVSYTRREPALKDHSETAVVTVHPGVIHRLVVRESWLKSRAPKVYKTDDLPALTRTDAGDRVEIGFDQTDAVSPEPPKGAPPFERGRGVLLTTDFADWPELSRTLFPLFDKAATLAPTSPLQAEIARIAKAHADPKDRALAALKLAEGDVRYLALLINAGGYTPAPADLTWSRRYGDCKGKTVLLLALLRGLGIEATPALVSTTSGDGLDRIPAIMALFDHVMVRAVIGGKVYWLDATRQGDENLDAIDVPNLHFALPLSAKGAGLEPLVPRDPAQPYVESRMRVDLSAGLDKPAKVHRETILRGDIGLRIKLVLTAASPTDRDRGLRDLLKGGRDWINPDKLDFTYDPATMTFTGTLDGAGSPPFTSPAGSRNGAARGWTPVDEPVETTTDLRRTTDYHKDAPYAVAYPAFSRDRIEVLLPDNGRGFSVTNGARLDETAAGVRYVRSASLNGAKFEAEVSRRALKPRFPASEAEKAEAALKTLNSYDVALNYAPVGPAKGSKAALAARDKDESVKRAEQAQADLDLPAAEAAYTDALAAAPEATLYLRRAGVRAQMAKVVEAEADLDAAIKLDPKNADALISFGNLALETNDPAEAKARYDAALQAAGNKLRAELAIESAYERAHRFAEAVSWADRYRADLPETSPARAFALNMGCWTRGRAGTDLQAALKLCDEAIALEPDHPAIRDSRALVRLRLGDNPGALADYDEVLKHKGNFAFASYGRSLAERRLGQTAKADADLAAAKAANPEIEAVFGDGRVVP